MSRCKTVKQKARRAAESKEIREVRRKVKKGIYPRMILIDQNGITRDDKGKPRKSKIHNNKGKCVIKFESTVGWFKKNE